MEAFLDDPKAVLEYREALKSYMGEGADFDPVYAELMKQVRDASANVPNFAKQAWVPNPDWKKTAYVIRGEYAGSPLSMKRDPVFKAIDSWRAAVAAGGKTLLAKKPDERKEEITKIVADLRKEYGFLSSEAFQKLSGRERADYQKRLGALSKDSRIQLLSDFAAHEILTKYERTGDAMASGDADILVKELGLLQKAQNYKAALASLQVDIPEELLTYMKLTSREATELLKAYEKGIASAKTFQSMGDPRLPPEILARLAQLEGEGVPAHEVHSKLSPAHAAAYDKWKTESAAATAKKDQFERAHTRENPYFFYATQEDPVRQTPRLKASGGLEVHVIPSPRPFISFAAGRKKGECVGGRTCEQLTPRRWARGALQGAETLFTETGDGKMEGYIGLTPVQHQGTKQVYGVVDIMSHALKGDVIVQSPRGKPVKYSFFDIFVDRQPIPPEWKGLSISDGSAVSMNVNAGEVVLNAPSYTENKVVGKPAHFAPTDPMADAIAKQYPRGMYEGGMIYDGMRQDGTKVVRLVPTKERRRWTEREFLSMMLEKRSVYDAFDDQSVVWKIALENNIPVKSPSYYRGEEFLIDLLRDGDRAYLAVAGKGTPSAASRIVE